MASDVQRELAGLQGVSSVNVRLGEHFAGREVEDGVGGKQGPSRRRFRRAGPDTLEENAQDIRRQGVHQQAGAAAEGSEGRGVLRSRRFRSSGFSMPGKLGVEERVISRYMDRRKEMGIDCSDFESADCGTSRGDRVPAEETGGRIMSAPETTRLAMEASGSLCSAMLQIPKTRTGWTPTP